MPALRDPRPIADFDPTQPADVHDQLNDKIICWEPRWAPTWHERRDHEPGVVEWDGLLLDGWEPLGMSDDPALTADELLDRLTDRECEDLLGKGTRSFALRPLRWRDADGAVHACEAAIVMRGPDEIVLAWTLCQIDVPTAHYIEAAAVTCPVCRALLAAQ